MAVVFSNNATTVLSSNITNSATSIAVQDGSVFPTLSGTDYFYATLQDPGNTKREIVKVTARSGNTLTVTRAVDGSSASAFSANDAFELRLNAAALNDAVNSGTADLELNSFTGDGSEVDFTLSMEALEANTLVYIDGVYQNKTAYSISGYVLTFSAAPDNGAAIEVTTATVAPIQESTDFLLNQFTGDGSDTTFTLSSSPEENQTTVFISGVYQSKSNYSISGTTLTFSTAPPASSSIEVMVARTVVYGIGTPSNDTVSTAKIVDGAVTPAKLSLTYATETFVGTAVSNLVDSSPAALDTLNELAAALGDDPNFATTVTNSIALKAPLASPSFTGNVSIGVVPEAWTYFSPIQAKRSSFAGSDGQTGVGYNWYFDGAYKYIANDYALAYQQNATSGVHSWSTAASGTADASISWSERMLIDSAGNLLVGKTATAFGTAGVVLRGDSAEGLIQATRANNECIEVNRTGTDGAIAVFAKDGTTVGSIAVATDINIGSGSTRIWFRDATKSLRPISTAVGNGSDGLISIGEVSGGRFKDLYLSGKIAKGTGGELDLRSDGGGFKYKQNLDVATAGCTFTGQSNRGDVAQIRLYQTATGADGGYIRFDTSNSGSTTPTEKARIHSAGYVTTPYQPTWGASSLSNTSSNAGTTSAGTLVFSGVLNNNGNHYSNSTGLFTAPVAGQYFVTFSGLYDDHYNNTGAVYIRRNTENLYRGYHQNSGSSYLQISMSGVVACSVGDTISIYSGIAGWHIGGETSFSGFLIG